MTPSPPGRPARLTAGALFVLLALAVVAPRSARAGCGHDLRTGSLGPHGSVLYDLHVLPAASQAVHDDGREPGGGPDRPCSGPTCSGRRSRPEAPNLSAPPSSERWCDTAPAFVVGAPRPRRAAVDDPSPKAVLVVNPLERPPRPALPL